MEIGFFAEERNNKLRIEEITQNNSGLERYK